MAVLQGRTPAEQLHDDFGPHESHHIDRELRLEIAAGYHLTRPRYDWFQATLQPYTVVNHDRSSQHNWGMALVLSGGLFASFARAAEPRL